MITAVKTRECQLVGHSFTERFSLIVGYFDVPYFSEAGVLFCSRFQRNFCTLILLLLSLMYTSNAQDRDAAGVIDSLVSGADSCVVKNDYTCAKDRYVNAFKSGMSRDSLAYLIAAMYIHKGNLDTALVFNLSCRSNTSLVYPKILVQRESILKNITTSDSATARMVKALKKGNSFRNQTIFSMIQDNSYQQFETNKYPRINDPGNLYDGFNYRASFSGLTMQLNQRTRYDNRPVESQIRLSTTGSFSVNDSTFSTMNDKFLLVSAEGLLNGIKKTVNTSLRLNIAFSKDTFSSSAGITLNRPFSSQTFNFQPVLMSVFQLDESWALRETAIIGAISFARLRKSRFSCSVGANCSFYVKDDETYFTYINGVTDSVVDTKPNRFYFDMECTREFSGPAYKTDYWMSLEKKPLVTVSGKTLELVSQINTQYSIVPSLQWESLVMLSGKFFFNGVTMPEIDKNNLSFLKLNNSDEEIVVVLFYDKSQGHYYSILDPDNVPNLPLTENNIVNFERKKRIDAVVTFQSGLNYIFGRAGIFSFGGWYARSFSTLSQNQFIIPMNKHNWGFNLKWKKEFVKKY
jgi:hypothetical protein